MQKKNRSIFFWSWIGVTLAGIVGSIGLSSLPQHAFKGFKLPPPKKLKK